MVTDNPPLHADEIFDATVRESGLEEYADAGLRHRFAVFIDSLNDSGRLAPWERGPAVAQLSEAVRRRLELNRDWAEHPEIADESIERPMFVVGPGRTGTTLMQVMLSLGDGCRTPLSWEVRRPSPPPGFDPASEPARIEIEDRHVEGLINVAPGFLLSHPYVDQLGHMECEDEDIFALDFHTAFPFSYTKVPIVPVVHHKAETGLIDAIEFHKRVLQHFQWKRPTDRWVLKTAQHYFQLPVTWQVYPDATCVWMHRDPVSFVPSVLGIIEHFYGGLNGTRLRGPAAEEIAGGLAAGYDAIVDQEWIDDDRVVHVRFDEFVRDQVGTVRRVFERTGHHVSAGHAARMQEWLEAPQNQSARHGRYRYSPEEYGLTEEGIRTQFARYSEHFLERTGVSA